MQMESDGNYIIFTPKTEADFFTLGRIEERHKYFEHAILRGIELVNFKISKKNLLELLLHESV